MTGRYRVHQSHWSERVRRALLAWIDGDRVAIEQRARGLVRLLERSHATRLFRRAADLAALPDAEPLPTPPPHTEIDETPPLRPIVDQLREPMRALGSTDDERIAACQDAGAIGAVWQALESLGLPDALVLWGQRLTSASVRDERAIAPEFRALLETTAKPNRAGDDLTVAARALAKHAARSTANPAAMWGGPPTGPTADKNAKAAELLEEILTNFTWWNVFHHHSHDLVCEVRLPTGFGARWSQSTHALIGLLDPFDADQRF